MYIIARYFPSRCVEPWVPPVAHLYQLVMGLNLKGSLAHLIRGSNELFWSNFVRCPSSLSSSSTFHIFISFSWTRGPISTKHPWVRGIQICSNEGPHPFPRGDTKFSESTLTKFKNLLQNHWANVNQSWHNASLGKRDLRFFLNEGSRPFPRGNYYEIAKIHRRNLKNLFSRTTGRI